MDPNKTWRLIQRALIDMWDPYPTTRECGRENAIEALENLADWLKKGGFPPSKETLNNLANGWNEIGG